MRHNPFAFDKPITLGGLDELFAHHRSLTGGWSMTSTPPENEPPANPPADPPPANPPAFEPITSQEDLDKRIGPRLQREREKFSDYDDLKRKAAEFDAAQEASKTEHEKAVEAARKEGETAAQSRANARVIASEAKVLLTQAGAHNPTAATALLGDLSGITISEAGEVDQAALKAKVDALKTSDAYLFGTGKPAPPKPDHSQGGGGGVDQAGVDRGREMFANRRKKSS